MIEGCNRFLNDIISYCAKKHGVSNDEVEITYIHYEHNKFKVGCLIQPTYKIDTLDIRLEKT